jgi:hypothetical protein
MARTLKAAEKGYTYTSGCDLDVVTCGDCGISHAIPTALNERALANSAEEPDTVYWYCPAGHRLRYNGRSEESKLRDRLERERERAGHHAARADQAEASARGQKAAASRARGERDRIIEKVKKGVCPVKGCGRTFRYVKRHIASQHPEFEVPVETSTTEE